MRKSQLVMALALCAAASASLAATTIAINAVDDKGVGKAIGTISLEDGKDGLVLTTDLKGLTPGEHGMHVHENGSCDAKEKDGKMVAGLTAGGHFDPDTAGKHEGPQGKGHKGDLPPLKVAADGSAKTKLVAPRLKAADLVGRAIIIHEGGDNFSDQPKPLGGGGARVACGVIK
ncbi:MAG TPA: superoxide dismutase [Cu-Zn] SodC [Burkholderiaceae bacterium]|nr:superoxide dismutase [Cu-Zn] SodC [Burkholderiaceae bacterium]